MDNETSKILRIHPEYQPEEKLPPAQFNLFTGEAEPVPQLIDKNIDDEIFVDDGISLVQSGDSSQIVLSGFGIFLSKKSERLIVKKSSKVIYEFPFFRLNEVIVASRGMSLSSDLVEELCQRGIRLNFLTNGGKPYAMLSSPMLSATVVSRREQIMAFNDERGLEFSKAVVEGKIVNQERLIRYFGKYIKTVDIDRFNKLEGIAERNSGFYVLRNHREIAEAQTLDVFQRHPDLNRFRGELFFSGVLDEEMGINFTKRELNPTQKITDKLKQELFPFIRSIRRKIHDQRATKQDSNIQHNDSQRVIAEKAKLLRVPPVERELRYRKVAENGVSVEPKNTERKREHFSRSTKEYQKLNCRFEEGHLGNGGPIYDCGMEGRKIIIRYNVDHPFYQRFLVENLSNPSALLSVDFLIFSLATAELRAAHEDNASLIETFRFDMSTNLKVLLSS